MTTKLDKESYIPKIIELYNKNIEFKDMSKLLGIGQSSIRRMMIGLNLPNRIRTRERPVGEESEEIIRLYNEGMNREQLAKKFNTSCGAITLVLTKNSVDIRPRELYNVDETFFDDINTEAKAYILGMWCADGNVDPKRWCMKISLQEQDKEILEKIKASMKYEGPISFTKARKDNHQNQCVLTIGRERLISKLIEAGCPPNKSLILKFPNISKNLVNHFIRGFFDGDGSLTFFDDRPCNIGIVSSIYFISELENIFNELNIHNTEYGFKNPMSKMVRINRQEDMLKFLNFIYKDATIYMDRKYRLYQQFLAYQESDRKKKV